MSSCCNYASLSSDDEKLRRNSRNRACSIQFLQSIHKIWELPTSFHTAYIGYGEISKRIEISLLSN